MCIRDVIKNINLKVFNLISRTNKAKYIQLHETCKCKCRLDVSVCNSKKRWDEDKRSSNSSVTNWLIKAVMIKDLFGILANVNMNRINHAILENI